MTSRSENQIFHLARWEAENLESALQEWIETQPYPADFESAHRLHLLLEKIRIFKYSQGTNERKG